MIKYKVFDEARFRDEIIEQLNTYNNHFIEQWTNKRCFVYLLDQDRVIGSIGVNINWDWMIVTTVYYESSQILTHLLSSVTSKYPSISGVHYRTYKENEIEDFKSVGFSLELELSFGSKFSNLCFLDLKEKIKTVDIMGVTEFSDSPIEKYEDQLTHLESESTTCRIPKVLEDICIIAFDDEQFIGGLIGKLLEDTLHIDLLVTKQDYRGLGVGNQLMKLAEEIAIKNNVFYLDLSTAEFQAKAFYESLGYEVVYTRQNYPKGYKNFKMVKDINKVNVINHYDQLVTEGNDPVQDSLELTSYMDLWDGKEFINLLSLDGTQDVLEIGIGTGRIAKRVEKECKTLTGIDISPLTIERVKDNLSNTKLICGDFLSHEFDETYDVIYSSLTLMHIEDKDRFLRKCKKLLRNTGKIVLSITKDDSSSLVYSNRELTLYPVSVSEFENVVVRAGLTIKSRVEKSNSNIYMMVRVTKLDV